jgi:hypothetical protein
MRVTRKVLQERLDTLNKMIDRDYVLDEDHYCGGYCLTGGEVSLCGRRSGKEMYSYLEAAIDFSPISWLKRKKLQIPIPERMLVGKEK